MSKIKLEDIRAELIQDGWTLVSDSYENLDSELEFRCPENHTVYSSWKKMRVVKNCPICNNNIYKQASNSAVISKAKGAFRVIALDQATHLTGYSIFDDGRLIHYGVYSARGNTEIERICNIKQWLMSMVENWKPDFVGLEGIQYQEEASGQKMGVTVFQALARLQGVLMETCHSMNIKFDIAATNTWRNQIGVKGRSRTDRKRSMQLIVKEKFDVSVTDDIADAIGIGSYFSQKIASNLEVQNWEN